MGPKPRDGLDLGTRGPGARKGQEGQGPSNLRGGKDKGPGGQAKKLGPKSSIECSGLELEGSARGKGQRPRRPSLTWERIAHNSP